MYNRVELVQIVRVRIVESGGLYVATSADVPPMHVAAFDRRVLREEIEDRIERYFHSIDENIRVTRSSGGDPNDLSSWEVLHLENRLEDATPYREAAE